MPLRIAFDLDGVLADMDAALLREAEVLFGEALSRRLVESATTETPRDERKGSDAAGPTPRPTGAHDKSASERPADDDVSLARFQMTARQHRRLWQHIESVENFWETLKEIEKGSIARLASLAADRRWEIIFLTRRPQSAGHTSQVQTQRWLQSNGFPLPSVYVVQGSRGRIAAALALDFVIDDTPENCLDVVVDSKARAVLVWRDDDELLPATARRLGVGVVKSVHECLDILAQVDAPPTERSGLVDRVKRLLGLKEQSPA